jgi:hypothetical protein
MATTMSLLNFFFSSTREGPKDRDLDPDGETVPVKMNLEERMAFRREVLFDVIKVSLAGKEIAATSYKLRISRADKRGHHFVVMIDLSNEFEHDARAGQQALADIGRLICANARSTELINVIAVYWRLVDLDERAGDTAAGAPPGMAHGLPDDGRYDMGGRSYASDIAPLAAS